jgi:hypothetical protein
MKVDDKVAFCGSNSDETAWLARTKVRGDKHVCAVDFRDGLTAWEIHKCDDLIVFEDAERCADEYLHEENANGYDYATMAANGKGILPINPVHRQSPVYFFLYPLLPHSPPLHAFVWSILNAGAKLHCEVEASTKSYLCPIMCGKTLF